MMKNRWFIVLSFAVFIGIKEASAQTKLEPAKEIKTVTLSNPEFHQTPYCDFGHDGDAQFPGGEKALMQFIYAHFKLKPKPKGKIITSFIVEKNGSLSDIKVLKGLTKQANDEAVNVIKSMPKWIPSIQAGKAIEVRYVLPFSLDK